MPSRSIVLNAFHRAKHGEGIIAVGMATMNLGTFGFQMAATRLLGPGSYGVVGSLMNVILVLGVVQLGLQATAARRIASQPQHIDQIERGIRTLTYRAALGLGGLMLLCAPIVDWALKLNDIRIAILLALCAVGLTITGGQAGILQGERRWWPLAIQYMALGVPRVAVGTALMLVVPSEFWAMVAVTLSNFVPAAVGWFALREGRDEGLSSPLQNLALIAKECVHNSQTLFAFLALSNVDLALIARHVLDSHAIGLYAAGGIVTKVVLFLPQFVVVTSFPSMASVAERRRAVIRGIVMVLGVGAACTLGVWLLSRLALFFIGDGEYRPIQGSLWIFAILGTLLSLIQLMVYSVLARGGHRPVVLIWLALAVLMVIGWQQDSISTLIWTVVAVDAALFAILFALALITIRAEEQSSPT